MFSLSRIGVVSYIEFSNLNRHLQLAEQGIDLILQQCIVQLSNYVFNICSKSMRKVIKALSEGNHDPKQLVKLVHDRITDKRGIAGIKDSLAGIISQVDTDMLRMGFAEMEFFEKQLSECK